MKKMSNSTIALLIGLGAVLVSIIFQSPFLLWGGVLTVFISLICCAKAFVNRILAKSGRSYYPSFWLITIIGYILFAATSVVTIGFIEEWDLTFGSVIAIIIFNLLASILYTYLYFLPYLIANKREHTNSRNIYTKHFRRMDNYCLARCSYLGKHHSKRKTYHPPRGLPKQCR